MRAFNPHDYVQALHILAERGHPELLEAFQQTARGFIAEFSRFRAANPHLFVRPARYRNRIVARAGRHIGQTRRGSNGWGSL